jgi:hypothetical protein
MSQQAVPSQIINSTVTYQNITIQNLNITEDPSSAGRQHPTHSLLNNYGNNAPSTVKRRIVKTHKILRQKAQALTQPDSPTSKAKVEPPGTEVKLRKVVN